MIICFYTDVSRQWSDQEFADKLSQLPGNLRDSILRKKRWKDRQLSIAGKLLLKEVLKGFGMEDKLSLDDLKFNEYHRPYFDAKKSQLEAKKSHFDANLSHSGTKTATCGTNLGQIGIDLELVKPIGFSEYSDYFTASEWEKINNYSNPLEGFYDFWTRKEAVLKAIGTGFHTPLNSVDVSEDTISFDGILYYIQPLDIDPNYKCHIATTIWQDDIQLIPIEL